MLGWMVYALLVSMALGAAALLAERAALGRRRPTRWPWMVATLASALLPVAMASVSLRLPEGFGRAAVSAASVTLRDATSIPLASKVIDWSGTAGYVSSTPVNTALRDIWLAGSFTLLCFLGVSTALLHRRRRGWTPGRVGGVSALISADVGPAVVGLIRPRIVVPAWVLRELPEQQRYVMVHEQSHLKARDPLLVATALAVLVAMPWNPLLWWQFHRLRCAIEVDCDRRVLKGGGDVGPYCETLIQIGQNHSEHVAAITGMSESMSFLEQRIRIMLSKPGKWARASAFGLVSIALGMAVFAAQVTPPAAPGTQATLAVDATVLDAYAGDYELSDYSLVTVARRGDSLTVTPIGQFMAQGTIDAPAISGTEFSIPSIDARLRFVQSTDRGAMTMVVTIHGAPAATAERVNVATAERIRRDLADRVRNQAPFPDSEKALRAIVSNTKIAPGMLSPFNQAQPIDPESQKGYFASLGPVQSYRFEGVTDYGWDIYDVQHAHGAQQVFIQLDRKGLLVSSVMRRQ